MGSAMEFNSFRLEPSPCLDCGKPLDGASAPGVATIPQDGDVTVCIYCGHIMAFDATGRLRALTSDEMYAVAGDPWILSIQHARKKLKGEPS